jgi:hypothetical protein
MAVYSRNCALVYSITCVRYCLRAWSSVYTAISGSSVLKD